MRLDAATLRDFYASPLGRAASAMIMRRLSAAWDACANRDVLCLGFPAAVPPQIAHQARRLVIAAPAGQGAIRGPEDAPGRAVVADERRLPFMDAVFDRVLLLHVLEEAENRAHLLREVWRVMAPEGRLIVQVANRRGLWALTEGTPFGHGRPYTRAQLAQALRDALFEPSATARAMYAPPWGWRPLVRRALLVERLGERIAPALGGLILMEAVKRLEARPDAPLGALAKAHVAVAPAR